MCSSDLGHVGITTSHGRRHGELEEVMRRQPVDFVQLTYNPADREAEARLLPLARERGIANNRATLSPAPKHADIAARVSTNREEVTREFGHLTREGIVKKGAGEMVIVDVARLIDMVDKVREQ